MSKNEQETTETTPTTTGTSSEETTTTQENSSETTETTPGTTEESENSQAPGTGEPSSEGNPITDALKSQKKEENEEEESEETSTKESGEDDQEGTGEEEQQGYEVVLDEDSPLSDEDLDEIAALAEENKWTKDQADKAIKERETFYKKGEEQANAPRVKYYQENMELFKKDPEFNGDKKDETYKYMAKAVDVFGDDELVAQLNRPEVGHNYALAKLLSKLGKEIVAVQMGGDGSILAGKGSSGKGGNLSPDQQTLRNLYPGMFKEE